jgi:hypothetical protein
MGSERADDPTQTSGAPPTWMEYYAEASRRRRARGWHRRRDFSDGRRRRRPNRSLILAGTAVALAVLATVVTLLIPR